MQFQFNLDQPALLAPSAGTAGGDARMVFVRNHRARRYILRVHENGVARVTIPRGGSLSKAMAFAERHRAWIEQQIERIRLRPAEPAAWRLGAEILFRGGAVRLEMDPSAPKPYVCVGSERLQVRDPSADLRPEVQCFLRALAARELPPRVFELAALHQLTVRRVTVRNQKSRWGSCSRRQTISLNWRLIQAPEFVRDYLILHELMHLRQMNHSGRFWREVEQACPGYETAERWLNENARLLR